MAPKSPEATEARPKLFGPKKIARRLGISDRSLRRHIEKHRSDPDDPIMKILREDPFSKGNPERKREVFAFVDEIDALMEGCRSIANPKPRGRRKATA